MEPKGLECRCLPHVPTGPRVCGRTPRLLDGASRVQLLSTEASLAFEGRLEDSYRSTVEALGPVWRLLCEAPTFSAVLRQYPTLRVVREVMVHPEDFGEATGLQEQLAC